ncbi:MAG: hypothetical protein WAU36_09255, partial [Cyclobacteriaceae bacterium]
MGRFLSFIIITVVSFNSLAQKGNAVSENVTKALSQAFKAQNPQESLKFLNQITGSIAQVS